MEKDINLVVEDVKAQIIDTINHSGLPISVVYYIMKDIMYDLDANYTNYIEQARKREQEQLQMAAPAEEMTEIEPVIED